MATTKTLIENSNIYSALAEFQTAIAVVPRDGVNPFFNSTYTTLGGLRLAIAPALAASGLALTQTVGEDGTYLVTTLYTPSGDSLSSRIPLVIPSGASPQQVGSALTYARRYGMSMALALASDDDDDGEAATAPSRSSVSRVAPRVEPRSEPRSETRVEPRSEPRVEPRTESRDGGGEVCIVTCSGRTSEKHGERNGKAWTRYGVLLQRNGVDMWASTFDADLAARCKSMTGTCEATLVGREFNGKIHYDITGIHASSVETIPF